MCYINYISFNKFGCFPIVITADYIIITLKFKYQIRMSLCNILCTITSFIAHKPLSFWLPLHSNREIQNSTDRHRPTANNKLSSSHHKTIKQLPCCQQKTTNFNSSTVNSSWRHWLLGSLISCFAVDLDASFFINVMFKITNSRYF